MAELDGGEASDVMRRYLVWLFALVANALLNHEPVLRVLGAVNVRLGWIDCVFLVYPSRRPLVRGRLQRWVVDRFRWSPSIGGVFRQGGGWGVTFAVTSSEPELIEARNGERLRGLAERMERLRGMLGAKRCSLAGVLPSVLASRGVSRRAGEGAVAAECVVLAMAEVQRLEGLGEGGGVVVLGCRGFVGREVMGRLGGQPRVYGLDRAEDGRQGLPEELTGRVLVVNLTWADVLDTYVDEMRSGMVVLNEVYPPPSARSVRAMADRGVAVYHLAGVEGFAFPPFPDAYAGGVPCCAAGRSEALRVRVVRLG